jgi:2-keto-3-deoxy-6-phosphogluconate aldolase
MQAATAVATAVKVFPVAAAVGVASLQALRSPLLQILLIATSNVNLTRTHVIPIL